MIKLGQWLWMTGLVMMIGVVELGLALMMLALWQDGTFVYRVMAGVIGIVWLWFAVSLCWILLDEKWRVR